MFSKRRLVRLAYIQLSPVIIKRIKWSEVKWLSPVSLFVTLWMVAYQAPPSMGFSRQEHCSGLPFPSPGDLPDPGIEPGSPSLQADTLTSEPPGKDKVPIPILIYEKKKKIFKSKCCLEGLSLGRRAWIKSGGLLSSSFWTDQTGFLMRTTFVIKKENYFTLKK